ncbi:hypothetical protein B0H14DRAFT_3855528 [Mycena olivaceomarginata]|nr:hypothetical protein B0H14DRAFT_3855528 [Mycena olivaceomarginata]
MHADTVGRAIHQRLLRNRHQNRHREGYAANWPLLLSAIANAYTALEAQRTSTPVPVLGIGERNGITPLVVLIANLEKKYNLHLLREIEDLVARVVQVKIPFMNPITGNSAFAHKARVYNKFQCVVSDPSAQVFQPGDFRLGLARPREVVV